MSRDKKKKNQLTTRVISRMSVLHGRLNQSLHDGLCALLASTRHILTTSAQCLGRAVSHETCTLFPWKTLTRTALAISSYKESTKKPSRKYLPSFPVKAKIGTNNISHCLQNSPSLSFPLLLSSPCPLHSVNIQEHAKMLTGSTISQQLNLYTTTILQIPLFLSPWGVHYLRILCIYFIFFSFKRPSGRYVNNLHWK